MFRSVLSICWVVALSAPAETPPAAQLAHRAWVLTDAVLDHHVEPPVRQAMLLTGLKGLLAEANCPVPADLVRRVSGLTTEAQFAEVLHEVWPREGSAPKLETALLNGLFRSVPGGVHAMTAEELKAHGVVSGNRYEGTGIQIRLVPDEQLTQIIVPFPQGPARKAGARPGDLIVAVDGESMKGRTIREVVDKIKGDAGTPITMTVRQPGSNETRELKMVRGVVPFDMVVGYRRTGEVSWDYRPEASLPVAYLRVLSLTSATAHDLRKLERQLLADGTRAVVLDLRMSGSGELHHAGQVADELLDGGLLWKVNDGRGHYQECRANRDCLFRDLPLVVLVDDSVRNKMAILAAILQEHRHAVVIGEATQGDPWVSGLVELPEGFGTLQLWTGVAERPDGGRTWQVKPDHVVKLERKQRELIADWQQQQASPEPRLDARPPEDPQLAKALAVLRGLLEQPGK